VTRSVSFYFDVVCPYAYLASTQLERLVAETGAQLCLRPILLGGLFRQIGQVDDPNRLMPAAKVAHGRRDLARWAQRFGVPLRMPAAHPRRTLLPMRVLSALEGTDRTRAMHALYAAYWAEGRDVAETDVVTAILDALGLDGPGLVARATGEEVKALLFATTAEAAARGAFGVPTFLVGEGEGAELFWGQDRLDWVRERLLAA
jgi:2-hydroxychromene-2-carboxylate isomerase